MQPMYPGNLPTVRLNMLNVVFAFDLSQTRSFYFLATTVANLVNRNLPIRFGFVPLVETGESLQLYKVVSYLLKTYNPDVALKFMKMVAC